MSEVVRLVDRKEFAVGRPAVQEFLELWPWIRKGLLEVKKNSHGVNWLPEHVRREIEQGYLGGTCELFVCREQGEPLGFYVMHPKADPWLGNLATTWHVWVMWSGGQGLMDRTVPVILADAKLRGYTAVDFLTSQSRIVNRAKTYGFKPTQILCRVEVTY